MKVENIKPLRNQILARRLKDEKYVGTLGIILGFDTQYQRNIKCEVLAVGPGYWKKDHYVPCQVKVGQIILVQPWSGTDLDTLNDPNLILAAEDVVEAIFSDD